MITTKTVFILGAGASKPYGYPTAYELRKKIVDKKNDTFNTYLRQYFGENAVYLNLHSKYERYRTAFEKSSTQSIDLHLSRNPKYRDIGKMLILHQIFLAESQSIFREETEFDEDWYSYLFTRLTDELQKPDQTWLGKNEVSFITFNYDRSLEHILYESMRNSFMESTEEEILNAVNSIPILHVFGKIADLDWQNKEKGIPYKSVRPNNIDLKKFIGNINTINEIDISEMVDSIQKLLKDTKRIFFLGFGYLDENIRFLGFPVILDKEQIVRGTGIGLSDKERSTIRDLYFHKVHYTQKEKIISNFNCKDLLREYL